MPERAGGFERKEIDDGFRALASARSAEDIGHVIDKMPVLRSPIFHAQLRQYRLENWAEFEKNPQANEGFMQVYDTFFTRLHFLANYAQSRSEPESQPSGAEPARQITPAFFEAVRSALGSAMPGPDGPTFHPRSDATAIAESIAKLTKEPVELPLWEQTRGVLWSAVVGACGRCHELRLVIGPYLLDVVGQPGILDSLRSAAFERSGCPRCSARTVLPMRTWISEQPSPDDPLAAICTLCRVRETEFIYRTPPGTVRKPEDDRILEIRLDMMIRQLQIEQPFADGVVLSNGIAYSLEELVWRIDQTLLTPAAPIDYQDMMAAIYQKLLSGLLNWQDTEMLIQKTAAATGKDWPISPAHPVGDLMKALIMNLVAEACAQVQEKPIGIRVSLTGLVVQCYAALGETARARIALARARDLAATMPENASTTEALQETESEILRAEGRREEAARIRPRREEPGGDTRASRLEQAEILQNKGLELRSAGRIRDAIQTLEKGLSILRALVAESDSADVRHTLSGTLANLAFVYKDCARNNEVLSVLAVQPIEYEKLPKKIRERLRQIGCRRTPADAERNARAGERSARAEFGREPCTNDLLFAPLSCTVRRSRKLATPNFCVFRTGRLPISCWRQVTLRARRPLPATASAMPVAITGLSPQRSGSSLK